MRNHICLIDGSNMLHRANSVAPRRERIFDGMNVGTVALFTDMMINFMNKMLKGKSCPSHLAVFFDPPRENSWRREVYAGYKANREPVEHELLFQIELMKAFLNDVGIANDTAPKHEADDLIGAYTEDAVKKGYQVSIISSDKDLMQLVRPGVLQYNCQQKKWFNSNAVLEKFGVQPERLGDYLALVGDSADGLHGAKGIGAKSAPELLKEFGDLEGILLNVEKLKKPSWRKSITEGKDELLLIRSLIEIDVLRSPRRFDLADLVFPKIDWRDRAYQWKNHNLQ